MEKELKIHKFDSSGEAYDACQCDEDVCVGDILIIESEEIVGIADTWPIAITTANGDLHIPRADFDWKSASGEPYKFVQLSFEIAKA